MTFLTALTTDIQTTLAVIQSETVDPLDNAYYLNDAFYCDYENEIVYLVIDDEITDQMAVTDAFVRNAAFTTNETFYNGGTGPILRDVNFSMLPGITVDNRYYIAVDRKITELKFLIDGKELEFTDSDISAHVRVYPLSDISFAEYIDPKFVINAEELEFEGIIIYTYNSDNHTFEGEFWHNDKTAEAIIREFYIYPDYNFDIFSVSENKIEARVIYSPPDNGTNYFWVEPFNLILEKNENGWYESQNPFLGADK
jgi:hypothetical protein